MKCRYKVRWFSSKRASLVLIWTLLIFIAAFTQVHFTTIFINGQHPIIHHRAEWQFLIPEVMGVSATLLSGWLADAKFGNYKVFRAGTILLFISTVMNCLLMILESVIWKENSTVQWVQLYLGFTSFIVGGCACVVTALPLGLDQMPDASSSSITSYIAWFVCCIFTGEFFGNGLRMIENCSENKIHERLNLTLIWSLIIVFFISTILISMLLLSPKWLIIEPKAPQSLRTIYHILKFAAKHKAPLNRSAFTYWKEDIPSRIDLGKSKYGGPFTTEQVEDVKTILRLMTISFSFYILVGVSFSNIETTKKSIIRNLTDFCPDEIDTLLVKSSSGYCIIGILVYEFFVYPVISHRLFSILKRIGTVSLIAILVSLVCFVLNLAHYLLKSNEATTEWIVIILRNSSSGLLLPVLLTSVLEFTTAQSPYNMRGLLVSVLATLIYIFVSSNISEILLYSCTRQWCFLLKFSIKTILCSIGFFLFCFVARWYKRRVRDEDYSTQRMVEEVYDRYHTAAAAESRSYGT